MVEKDFAAINATAAAEYLCRYSLRAARTFKVEAKRRDKSLADGQRRRSAGSWADTCSPASRTCGWMRAPPRLVTVTVEVPRSSAPTSTPTSCPAPAACPVGTGGKAMLLLSGGIDSPVAGYMMAKRGLEIDAVHFAAPPYTSERAKQKVHRPVPRS